MGLAINCIRFWARLDQNSVSRATGPIGLKWENSCDNSSAFILSGSSFLQVARTTIKFLMGLKFGKIQPGSVEFAALEHLQKSP